jgi:hypothetical protein
MTTKIKSSNLDADIVTGFTELNEQVASDDLVIIYDVSTGTLKKVTTLNSTLSAPTVTSISPTNVDSKDSATTTTFTVTGTGFVSGVTAVLLDNSGAEIAFNTITRDSSTQLTCVLNNGLITGVGITNEPYDIKVTTSLGSGTLTNQINVDQRPVFVTAAGSLGTQRVGSFSATVEATDPESAGAVRYDVVGGTLPTGITLNSSTGVVSGSITPETAETVYNFTIQASDVDSNVSLRDFSITLSGPSYSSFTSSGTFAVPSGITVVDVLVVAGGGGGGSNTGGGGGAGGLIFRPGFPVTPGGTVSVTVGCGSAAPGPSTSGTAGQDSVFGTLTAKGGGGGGGPGQLGVNGGSGGGGGNGTSNPPTGAGGQGTQPTQPGDSGTYGFGNGGGRGDLRNAIFGGTTVSSGGGGGAGASGDSGSNGSCPGPTSGSGPGGIGRAYTISDGTTPVFYAGGGGGGKTSSGGVGFPNPSPDKRGEGGQGGGGDGGVGGFRNSVAGTANRGGGGGGTHCSIGSAGGKGIVIVKY